MVSLLSPASPAGDRSTPEHPARTELGCLAGGLSEVSRGTVVDTRPHSQAKNMHFLYERSHKSFKNSV